MIFPQRSAALNVSRSHGGVCPPSQACFAATDTRSTDAVVLFTACDGCWVVKFCRFSFGYTQPRGDDVRDVGCSDSMSEPVQPPDAAAAAGGL